MMKRPLSTLVFFFICMAILVIHSFASDIPNAEHYDSAKQTESVKQTEWWPLLPWGHPHFPTPRGPWALPPLPAHQFPPFQWPKPGNGWALPPLPAHKFPPFNWPKPGNGWALPPLPAHKFPPFTWPKPGNGWAFPPLPAHRFPPFPWGHASSTQSSETPNKCWLALQEIEGCVHDIAASFLAGKFNVGSSCCKTFTDIKDECSANGSGIFNVPFFHQALQQHCSSQVAPPSKA